jgi:hypothetical protein
MKNQGKVSDLERQYAELFVLKPASIPNSDDTSLEQPYAGRIVETRTTYAVPESNDEQS